MTSDRMDTTALPNNEPTELRAEPAAALSTMTKLLRLVGAGLLVVSASTFMIQQWDLGNDLVRYLTLLGHTALLTAAGFFCGIKMNESRGARTFLGLVIVSVPVHFAVLGGLLYSQFSLDGIDAGVTVHAMWTASSPAQAVGLTLLGIAVLLPMTLISMAAFARPFMKPLSLGFAAMNLLLLVPIRQADGVGVLSLIAAGLFCVLETTLFWKKPLLQNVEGRFVKRMLLAPLGILVGRSLYLYELSLFAAGLLLISFSVLSFLFVLRQDRRSAAVQSVQVLNFIPAALGWGLVVYHLTNIYEMSNAVLVPLTTLPAAALLIAMSFFVRAALMYRRVAALLAVVPLSVHLLIEPSLSAGLICLSTGIATLLYGVFAQQKTVVFAGAAGVLCGIVYHVYNMVRVESLGHWAVLSVVGAVFILGASLFERRSERTLKYWALVRARLTGWNY